MEDWAKRVVQPGEEAALTELKLAITRRRQAEKQYVPRALAEVKSALMDALASLSQTVCEESETSERVLGRLSELAAAVETDDLSTLKLRVKATVEDLTSELERSRRRAEHRLVEMGEHVEILQADLSAERKKSATDSLTGLHNRGAFDQDLERIARLVPITRQPLSIVMVDIDHFKKVNDTYGHPVGDVVIQRCADALVRAYPRKSDYVARYGGEEFVVVLRGATAEEAQRMTERFLESMRAAPIDCRDAVVPVTCSAGIAQLAPGEAPTEALGRADKMLYRAKKSGRDRVEVDR